METVTYGNCVSCAFSFTGRNGHISPPADHYLYPHLFSEDVETCVPVFKVNCSPEITHAEMKNDIVACSTSITILLYASGNFDQLFCVVISSLHKDITIKLLYKLCSPMYIILEVAYK